MVPSKAITAFGLALTLASCGEPASVWNPDRGRFTSREDRARDEMDKAISRREIEQEKERK